MKKFLIFCTIISTLITGCASSGKKFSGDIDCKQAADNRPSYTCHTSRATLVAELDSKSMKWIESIMVADENGNASVYTMLCTDGFNPETGICNGAAHLSTVNCLATGTVQHSTFNNWNDIQVTTTDNPLETCEMVLNIQFN